MASRIQGITVEIGGDTTKLSTALSKVNKEIRDTQAQLKDVNKLLKLDPGNAELMAQKQRLLSQAVSETKEKLDALKLAGQQANEALAKGVISRSQYDALQREIIETEQALRDKAREMGSRTKFSASEAAEAMNYMAMAGWKTGEILMPSVRQIVGWIQGLVDWLNGLDEGTKKVIVMVALVVAALGPVSIPVSYSVPPKRLKVLTGFRQKEKIAVEYFDTETLEMKKTEMFVEGYKAVLVKDTSYEGLWKVSFMLKEF